MLVGNSGIAGTVGSGLTGTPLPDWPGKPGLAGRWPGVGRTPPRPTAGGVAAGAGCVCAGAVAAADDGAGSGEAGVVPAGGCTGTWAGAAGWKMTPKE